METVRNMIMENARYLLATSIKTQITGTDGKTEQLPVKFQITQCGDYSVINIMTFADSVERILYPDGIIAISMAYRWEGEKI